jgi:hypothetical protein
MYLYENCETNNLVLVIEAPQGFLYPYCTPNKELKSNNNDKINTISNATNKSLKYHSQLSWIKIKQLIPSALHNHSLRSYSITILWSKKWIFTQNHNYQASKGARKCYISSWLTITVLKHSLRSSLITSNGL